MYPSVTTYPLFFACTTTLNIYLFEIAHIRLFNIPHLKSAI